MGIRQAEELWIHDPQTGEFNPTTVAAESAMLEDAIAYYQTAFGAYREGRLRPLPQDRLLR